MFRKIFFPKTVTFKNNLFNKNIFLYDHFLEPTLVVDGLVESGSLLRHIWHTGIRELVPPNARIKNVLALGLGGGSNVRLVSKLFPQAKITAIEIDPQMVEVAESYFGLKKIKNLKIITQDALEFVDNLKSTNYDLVLVDCFVGKNIPTVLQELSFLEKLASHSTHLLVNRIWYNEFHTETVFFLRKISKVFTLIKAQTQTNIIVKLI